MSETTLRQAKEWLRTQTDKGANCPCCNQFVKFYKRKLYASMSRMLIALYYMEPDEYHHIQTIAKAGGTGHPGDFAKLVYWEMIIEKTLDGEDKRSSGWWKITEKGQKFVQNQLSVLSHCLVYNKKVLDRYGDSITIRDSLGKKFSYEELMGD